MIGLAERVSDSIRRGTDYLRARGIANPTMEAEVLLSHILGVDRAFLYAHPERVLKVNEVEAFYRALERRGRREPLQYILGRWEFWSLEFEVGPGVLIPRPETEILVEEALRLLDRIGGRRVLEIGTGSGNIAVPLAKGGAEVWSVDISRKALCYARRNASHHRVSDRIRLIQGRGFDAIKGSRPFDLIISNPPYIPTREIGRLQPEIRDHEPLEAIDGGPDGLSVIRDVVRKAPHYLRKGGWLLMEIGNGQALAVRELIERDGRYSSIGFRRDYGGVERVVIARGL